MSGFATVLTPEEILDKAFRKASLVSYNERNSLERNREIAIRKAIAVSDIISATLLKFSNMIEEIEGRPPYYLEMLDDVFGLKNISRTRNSIIWSGKRCFELRQDAIKKYREATGVPLILRHQKAFYGRVSSVIKSIRKDLELSADLRKWVKSLPTIGEEFTIVIAGYPNVGKSTIVSTLSSGRPEVNSYPFTTKNVNVGHIDVSGYRRAQLIDTPGVLDRPVEQRNPIEKQAITAIRHLAHHIFFIIDPTETCGYSLQKQEALLKEVEELISVPITVISGKSDIAENVYPDAKLFYSHSDEESKNELTSLLFKLEEEWFREHGCKI